MPKEILHILVPVYNEGENFPSLYKQLKKSIKAPHRIVIVYDFDDDSTIPIAKKYSAKDKSVVLLKNTSGRGVLNAIKFGINYVTSGPVLITMADLSDDLSIVDSMLDEYKKGAAVVCGSRYMKGGGQIGGPIIKRTLSRLAGVSLFWIRRIPTHDITNNFKMYDKSFLSSIDIESKSGFEVAMEITVKAFKAKKRIVEIPTVWRDRTAGEANFKLWRWLPSYLRWYFYAFH